MSIDFNALLYGPTFAVFGVSATLTPIGGDAVVLTVIDRTEGIEVESGEVGVQTLQPGADVKVSDLNAASITLADLDGAALVMNGGNWKVQAVFEKPTPSGSSDGLVTLLLRAT